ncbi:ankyrin repeat-containing domain protein [Baffinella frigidus]|nr:ankyrin repeat-containing domain protein [Cryptophyta sp. CCMP2293]
MVGFSVVTTTLTMNKPYPSDDTQKHFDEGIDLTPELIQTFEERVARDVAEPLILNRSPEITSFAEVHARGLVSSGGRQTLLMMAAVEFGEQGVIKFLLGTGVDPEETCAEGKTALMHAAKHRLAGAVFELLERGALVNTRNSQDSSTALMCAAEQDENTAVIYMLLQAGAAVNAVNADGETALHVACAASRADECFLLICNGADIFARDNEGNTPLHVACREDGVMEIALIMVHLGGDIYAVNNEGESAMHISVFASGGFATLLGPASTGAIEALMGLDPTLANVFNNDGDMPIHLYAREGWTPGVEQLAAVGGSMSVPNSKGETPAQIASDAGEEETLLAITTALAEQQRK